MPGRFGSRSALPPTACDRSIFAPTRSRPSNILLALRLKDLTYSADLLLTGELKGELGRDGLPTYFRGKIAAGAGNIIDSDTPDYPMAIDSAEVDVEWDAGRRVLVAPFKIISGANRITLLAHLEPPNDNVPDWQMGFSGGTIVLAGIDNEPPLIFNRIAIALRFDTEKRRVLLTQADISNGEIGVAGTGSIDYSGEPRLTLGFAGTPMSASALKRIWPTLIVPEVREWVIERVERGSLQRIEIGVNSPVHNLSRRGPPIPDDGLSVNIVASGVTLHPVDDLPSVRDADLKAHVTGRTATVTIGQAVADTPSGPQAHHFGFRVRGAGHGAQAVAGAGQIQDRRSGAGGRRNSRLRPPQRICRHPDRSQFEQGDGFRAGHARPADQARTDQGRHHLCHHRRPRADLPPTTGDEPEARSQHAESRRQQRRAIRSRATSRSTGRRPRWIIASRAMAMPTSNCWRRWMMRAAPALASISARRSAARIPIKVTGKIGTDSRVGIDADLTALKLDNILPGWVKLPGKASHAVFNVVQKPQSTRFEDIVIDGGGVSIKGSLEVDQNGDLMNANFPTYSPSEGDKASLKADRGPDGVLKVIMRGDVFDGRGFLKSAISGKEADVQEQDQEPRYRYRREARRGGRL